MESGGEKENGEGGWGRREGKKDGKGGWGRRIGKEDEWGERVWCDELLREG